MRFDEIFAFLSSLLDQESCAKYGWRAERTGEIFDFCTATKGYADFRENGVTIRCQQQVGPVPDEYQGQWALVPEKNEKCEPDNGPAEVTDDNIETYHEDYCRVTAAKRITSMPDSRLEVTCIAGGEGGPETPVQEVWRIRQLLGKEIFLQQSRGGIALWQRCP